MKRYFYIFITLVFCATLTGCGLWMDGEYLSVTPHQEQNVGAASTVTEITSYSQLPDVLVQMVSSGAASGAVIAPELNQKELRSYLDSVVDEVMSTTPVAAYAVENITYEIGTNRGEFAIAFYIDYYLNRSEILRIKHAQSTEETAELVGSALDDCEDSLVVLVEDYSDADFTQIVRTYAYNHPDKVMEIPQMTVRVYPEEGKSRIIELRFTYQTDRETLMEMQEQVELIFTSAELYVKETAQIRDIYTRLYSFLMERHEYSYDASITPSYSLLYHGVGDSHAFATVYAAMCRQVGLDCRVLTGTRNGMIWHWNVLRFRGEYYHVDLLQSNSDGAFRMLRDSEMVGYIWDDTGFN